MDKNIIISVDGAVKKFKEHTALNNVSLQLERDKIYGIVGRNGSGKTVLFKCICGFMPLTSGTITVGGTAVGQKGNMPSNIGVIIETPGFLPNYSGFKNLKFLAMIKNKISNEQIKSAMRLVGLDPESKKHVGKYSLGMRQRLGIAQAIMESPDILILDEPMNGLDNDGVNDMRTLFLKLRDMGKTIVLASHNREDIEILCDKTYEMDKGRLIRESIKNSEAD